jgi:LacI family transcriptional regulator
MKRVSLDMIAKEVNLSKTTVSLVLNGKGDLYSINPNTQALIFKTAKKLKFRPNIIARNLSRGTSMTLALIVPRMIDSYYGHIAESVESLSSLSGYQVLIGTTHENPKKEKELLMTFDAQQVDGIIIASTQQNLEDLTEISASGTPIVLFDRYYPGSDLPYVVVDNYQGVIMLVNHLIDNGRKNIGYVGLNLNLTVLKDRQRGFREAIGTNVNHDENVKIINYQKDKIECGRAVEELFLNNGVDGIVFETQYLALYGISKINEMNINYPETVSVVSFGDHTVFSIFKPAVTAIEQPVELIAERSMSILMRHIEDKLNHSKLQEVIQPVMRTRNT